MLVTNLQPMKTALSKLKEIPDTFFTKLEAAKHFDDDLFPSWLLDSKGNQIIFGKATELRNRFKAIFEKYKAITNKDERKKIVDTYFDTNKISSLCNNDDQLHCFKLTDLPEEIRKEIDVAFLYLYASALNHPPFEEFVNANITDSLKDFAKANAIDICPFCGLEMLLQIEGQARLPLDHWLNKDSFPFASINFDNLVPIGTDCNSKGVKGCKDVLKDIKLRPKKRAFYPYAVHQGFNILITCTEQPNIDNEYGSWNFSVTPNNHTEADLFESWNYIFNISTRYKSYFDDYLILNWKTRYIEFIKNDEDGIDVVHAQNIDEFKYNLRQWKRTFKVKRIPASRIYLRFIDYLLDEATNEYLFGVVESFKSKVNAGVI